MLLVTYIFAAGCAHRSVTTNEDHARALEAKKRLFANYFNTIKSQVRAKWAPDSTLTSLDPERRMLGIQSRYTLLRVDLDPIGTLRDVRIQRRSGIEAFDQIAVSAFREAAPFPRAPQQLVIEGRVRFCFGFHCSSSNQVSRAGAEGARSSAEDLMECTQ